MPQLSRIAIVLALLIRPQSADEPVLALVAFAKRLAEDTPRNTPVVFAVNTDSRSAVTDAAVAAAFARAGLTVRTAAGPAGPDTLVVRLTTPGLDSAARGRRFYSFGVNRQRCSQGRLHQALTLAEVRCPGLLDTACAYYRAFPLSDIDPVQQPRC
jgi:hypothetical protein